MSGLQQQSTDGCGVGEDADSQDHDDGGRHGRAHAQLRAEEDEQAGDDHVPEERGHEDTVGELAFEPGAPCAKERVEPGDDGDG